MNYINELHIGMAAYLFEVFQSFIPLLVFIKSCQPLCLLHPFLSSSTKVNSSTSHQWTVREQPLSTGSGLGTVPGNVFSSNVQK